MHATRVSVSCCWRSHDLITHLGPVGCRRSFEVLSAAPCCCVVSRSLCVQSTSMFDSHHHRHLFSRSKGTAAQCRLRMANQVKDEHADLRRRLMAARRRRQAVRQEADMVNERLQELHKVKVEWSERVNTLEHDAAVVQEELHSVRAESRRCVDLLKTLMQINVANDCFHLWHAGPFATINGFKLGRLPPVYPVEWSEINAALGQATLLLSTIVDRAGFRFRNLQLLPMGSFSKVVKVDDPSSSNKVNLYYDENFSFFPKRSFNTALHYFLRCIEEFGEFVEHQDPTLRLPYRIKNGQIGGVSIASTQGFEEQWTRALKFMLTDLKWLVSWASKHVDT